MIVGVIDALLCGVVAALATQALGGAVALQVAIGFLVVLGSGMVLGSLGHRACAASARPAAAVPELSRQGVMRKISAILNISMDRVIQAPGRSDEDTRGGFDRRSRRLFDDRGRAATSSWSTVWLRLKA